MCRFCLLFVVAVLSFPISAYAESVTASGCVEPGVEAGCLILNSGGKIYEIKSAKPAPMVGTYGTVMGTIFDGASFCMQGTILNPATWAEDATKSCPEVK